MNINIICKSYLDKILYKNNTKNNIVDIYFEQFKLSNYNLMLNYFNKYVPYEEKIINDRINKVYNQLKENSDGFKRLCRFGIKENIISSFLNSLLLSEDTLKKIEVNFFIGVDTCNGFIIPDRQKVMINIAIEKYINCCDNDIRLTSVIIHELTHAVRFLECNESCNTLADILVDEGLACVITQNVMNLHDKDQEELIYPKKCFIQSKEAFDKYFELYLNNINSEDTRLVGKLMHFGDEDLNISPGLGYYIGVRIIKKYLERFNCSIADLFYSSNDKIINSF